MSWTARGVATALRAVVAEYRFGQTFTRSELEERFLALCESACLPRPGVNTILAVDGHADEVDFIWAEHRLVAETDGYASHGTRRAFERDRERDRRLLLAGWRVVRFTWRQVIEEPAEVISTVRALIAQPGP